MANTTEVAHIIPNTLRVCGGGGGGEGVVLFVPLLPLLTICNFMKWKETLSSRASSARNWRIRAKFFR